MVRDLIGHLSNALFRGCNGSEITISMVRKAQAHENDVVPHLGLVPFGIHSIFETIRYLSQVNEQDPPLVRGFKLFFKYKFPVCKSVASSMTTYLLRLEEVFPIMEPRSFHPSIAKGVLLLPVENESFFKALLTVKLFFAANVVPPSAVWALVFDRSMSARDIVALLRHDTVWVVASDRSRPFFEMIQTSDFLPHPASKRAAISRPWCKYQRW